MSKHAVQLFVKHVYRWNFKFNTMHIQARRRGGGGFEGFERNPSDPKHR